MHQQRPPLRTVAATHATGVVAATRAPHPFDRSSAVAAICAFGADAAYLRVSWHVSRLSLEFAGRPVSTVGEAPLEHRKEQ